MNIGQSSFDYKKILINYNDQGQGQPLVLLHGYGASTYSWRYVSSHFSKSYRVISIDLKGFGLSDKPTNNNYSVLDQSYIISEFIKEHNLDNIILVGHSLGGAVALFTYLMHFEHANHKISKLILFDTASYKQNLPDYISILTIPIINELLLRLTTRKFRIRMVLKKVFFDQTKITEEMVTTYASYLSLPGSSHALIKTAEQIIPSDIEKISEQYKSIRIPVLLIWGERDKIVPLDVGKKLFANIPNSKLIVIPNCGHAPQEECPSKAIKEMESFLSYQTESVK